MTEKPRYRVQAKGIQDSYQNLNARVGIGAGSIADGQGYAFNPVTRLRWNLETMYRGSWIIGVAVDAIADDMVKKGLDINSGFDPNEIETLNGSLSRLGVPKQFGDAIRWGRLFGGAIAVLMIDGQDVEQPLNVGRVGKGQFKGLYVFDRWMLQPSTTLVSELGPDFGKPQFYTVTAGDAPFYGKRIHHTRASRFEGHTLPHFQRQAEQGWGMSVVERIFDRLTAFDSATAGTGQLVYKAYLRTMKVHGLRQILAAGGELMEALIRQVNEIRRFQSNEGLTLIDAEDEVTAQTYTFSGLDSVLLQFAQQISGATGIPMVRLFGQSPAGLNSTGESDLRTYYDGITSRQDRDLRTPWERVLEVAAMSELGKPLPDDFGFKFNSLWEMTEREKADTAEVVTRTVVGAFNDGAIDRGTALKELRQSAEITGIWTNITNEMIEEAEDEEPPAPEGNDDLLLPPSDAGQKPGAEGVQPGKEGRDVLREEPEKDREAR